MDETEETRHVTDARVLAAMTHPVRRRLLDVLKVYGPATVSVLAERTGERVPNISHHLKVLANAELMGDASELARNRRERWWRLLAPSVRCDSEDFADEPATAAVAQAALSLNLDRQTGLARAWQAATGEERSWWHGSSFSTEKWLRLTPEELAELSEQVIDVLEQWGTRTTPDDGQERRPVLLFAYGIPARP